MQAIFPCEGALIVQKIDVEKIENFYNSGNVPNYSNDVITEIDNINYFSDFTEFVFDNANPATVSKLRKVLNIPVPQTKNISNNNTSGVQEDTEDLIDDESIFSNPFFTTLKPVDE